MGLFSLVCINTMIFITLSAFHFYWAAGGDWGIDATIPEQFKSSSFVVNNQWKMTVATLIVAFGLLLFAFVTASNYWNFSTIIPIKWSVIATRLIALIFLLRAIGDFNICGFFRKENTSLFAKMDRRLYSPLCFFLAIVSFLITVI